MRPGTIRLSELPINDAKGIVESVEVKNGEVVINYKGEKWEPKVGAVVKNDFDDIYIFSHKKGDMYESKDGLHLHKSELIKSNNLSSSVVHPTTRQERINFFEALTKAGYKYNSKRVELTKMVEKFVPVDGDFVTGISNGKKLISIFKNRRDVGNSSDVYLSVFSDKTALNCEIDWISDEFIQRLSTDTEKQLLLDALAKDGKIWNAEKKCVERLRWRAEIRKYYYSIRIDYKGFRVAEYIEDYWDVDNDRYNLGNYYQTEKLAQSAIDEITSIFARNL